MQKKYKSGQVASALFSKKKTGAETDGPLNKLFASGTSQNAQQGTVFGKVSSSANKSRKKVKSSPGSRVDPPSHVSHTESKPFKSVSGTGTSAKVSPKSMKRKQDVPQPAENSPGKPKKVKKKKSKDSKETVNGGESPGLRAQSKSSSAQTEDSKKALSTRKRKSEDERNENGEVKRPRRDRVRDKVADNRTIFVGNCPLSADKKTLRKLFKSYGKIETIRFRCAPPGDPNLPRRAIVIMKNFHEQCDSFVAYVVFEEEKSAHKALEKNGYLLDNLHLRVDIASSAKKHDKKRSIFVGNLPFTVKEEEIRGHFEDCGDVNNVRIVRDRQTSLGKGICYIQFDSKDAVTLALKLNGSEFRGRTLRVMTCASKPKKKDKDLQSGKTAKIKPKGEKKKPSFAPSNLSSTSFKNKLKAKKEKRLRKIKKKKEVFKSKKTDGLSAIFGDTPASSKTKTFKGKNAKSKAKGKAFHGGKKTEKGFKGPKKFSQKGKGMQGKRRG